MISPRMFLTLLKESLGSRTLKRVPEPRIVMSQKEYVEAFDHAGKSNGNLAPTHLFLCGEISKRIQACKRVLDLGCGSGQLLNRIAQLNPQVQFVGLDLSTEMLTLARSAAEKNGVQNIEYREGDMTQLQGFENQSFDAVISSLALHHLPGEDDLKKCLHQIKRVLKPQGALHLFDFSLLKHKSSVHFFASLVTTESRLFVEDFIHSMKAAFEFKSFLKAFQEAGLDRPYACQASKGIPFLMAAGSTPQRLTEVQSQILRAQYRNFSELNKKNFKDILGLLGLSFHTWFDFDPNLSRDSCVSMIAAAKETRIPA